MLRVRLLGPLTVELDDRTVELPSSRRARSILALLACEPRREHSRSEIASRFWPDVLDESARLSLRTALSSLRRALGEDGERHVVATRDTIALDPVWTDVEEFERLVEAGCREEALRLCRGPLLSGLDDDWVLERRDEQRERVSAVLAELAAEAEAAGDDAQAIAHTRRQAALDPLAEEPVRDLMRRLAAAGDRAGAITAYTRLQERLRSELRIAPSAETRAAAERLRHDADEPAPDALTPSMVTLLFTDLVGSTELLSTVGDDEAERLRRVHFGLLRDVLTGYGGTEVKNLGDGLMVVFASAVDAVGCAIAIQQVVDRHNARAGDVALGVRIGLNVGEPFREEDDWFGTPVVVAKRLCDRAAGGQVLASEVVRAVVGSRGGFEFAPVGPLALKGLSEPVATCEVVWTPTGEERIPLPDPLANVEKTHLVGRADALARLAHAWTEARAGRRRVVGIAGDPGIGKTRLAFELGHRAHAEDGAIVLLGRCHEEPLAPYQPIVEALAHYIETAPLDELRVRTGEHRALLAGLVPALGRRLAVRAPALAADPETERVRMFDAVAALMRDVAGVRPVIVLLDDMHWADPATLLLLRHLVRATDHAPVLIVLTYRAIEVDDEHPLSAALADGRRQRALESIALDGLAAGEVVSLVRAHAGADAPETFATAVHERAEGNPFFVEEILRALPAERPWEQSVTELPESVRDLIRRRLRSLEEPCLRVLGAASVLGAEFDLDVLGHVADLQDEPLIDQLEQASAARAVDEAPGAPGRYAFAHGLVRETVYRELSGARRARLHARAGEALVALATGRPDDYAESIAHHFREAGDLPRALEYTGRAAAAAHRRFAVEAALGHYAAALELARSLGRTPEEDATVRALLLERSELRAQTADFQGAASDAARALAGARAAGDRPGEVLALNGLGRSRRERSSLAAALADHEAALRIADELGDVPSLVYALQRVALLQANVLALDRAVDLSERALTLARQAEDDGLVALALDSRKHAALLLGDRQRLEDVAVELELLCRDGQQSWLLAWGLAEASLAATACGELEAAEARLERAAELAREAHAPQLDLVIHDARAWLLRARGRHDEALAESRRARAIVDETGTEGFAAWVEPARGCILLDRGRPEEAARELEHGLERAEHMGAVGDAVRCAGLLAWARHLAGDEDGARAAADRTEALLAQATLPPGGAFLFGGHAIAALARVRLAQGDPAHAARIAEPLLAAAERTGWQEAIALAAPILEEARQRPGQKTS